MRRPTFLILLVVAVGFAGCVEEPTAETPGDGPIPDAARLADLEALAASPVLVLDTEMGPIRVILFETRMPITSARIESLVASGFYDGTLIHRVVDDFVIQGGDPTGTGEGGSGQMIPFETHPDLPFASGALGMAQWTPGTADSQWFITEKPAPHLNDANGELVASSLGPYPMFGQVISGMETVRAISKVPVVPGWDRPVDEIRVRTVRIESVAGSDLLSLPRALEANIDLGGGRFHLEQPQHLYADHAFVVQVTQIRPGQGPLNVTFRQEGQTPVVASLQPVDDGSVLEAAVTLPVGGAWEEAFSVGGVETTWDRFGNPWSESYAEFAA